MPDVSAYILGQAQKSFHDVSTADHPFLQMRQIARSALADAGMPPEQVDAVACVDPLSWTYADLGKKVAAAIGCNHSVKGLWMPAGGTTPQDLLHDIAAAMKTGELDVAIIVGAEAMRTRRKAVRAGEELDWPERDKTVSPMRGQRPFTSKWEAQHGLRLPIQLFPLLENAIRHAKSRDAEEQINIAAGLLHKNARVAANNPHAWFQDAPSAKEIATITADNRMIAYPYSKRMNAIMDVDQAAAIVVVSDRYLAQAGERKQAVAVLGGTGAEEVWNPIQRKSLSECLAMKVALKSTLKKGGLCVDEVDAFDFYSCFPAPIELALDALQIDFRDPRPFSITGGLAYAGGPGNNYVMHSLATAVARLRHNPNERILVTGVGMANTKHAATLLAHAENVPHSATGLTDYRIETADSALVVDTKASGTCTVVTYTIEYNRDGDPINVIYILDTRDSKRAIANVIDPSAATSQILKSDPIGKTGELIWDEQQERQFFNLQA